MDLHWTADEKDGLTWDQALNQFPEAPFSLLYGWRKVYEKTFGLPTYYLLAREGDRVVGLCPLVLMRSPLFGRGSYLISLPFLTRAGLWVTEEAVRPALIDGLIAKAQEVRADFVELRELVRGNEAVKGPANEEHVQMVLELPENWERYEKEIAPRLRQVKRAKKEGLSVRQGREEPLLRDFYYVFSRRMRDLFFPVYPRRFFELILNQFPKEAELLVVYAGDKPWGGMLTFSYRGVLSLPFVASLFEPPGAFANQLLYYEALFRHWSQGCRLVDFCRSQRDSGTYRFKRHWKARPRPLVYHYPFCRENQRPSTVAQARGTLLYRVAQRVWPRLPLSTTQWLGGRLIKQLVLA